MKTYRLTIDFKEDNPDNDEVAKDITDLIAAYHNVSSCTIETTKQKVTE